ncbi:MAG: hypothetical protein J6L77_01480 [Coprococcus sp.]|nr:hypothetical protein [Coprococcus sp.]
MANGFTRNVRYLSRYQFKNMLCAYGFVVIFGILTSFGTNINTTTLLEEIISFAPFMFIAMSFTIHTHIIMKEFNVIFSMSSSRKNLLAALPVATIEILILSIAPSLLLYLFPDIFTVKPMSLLFFTIALITAATIGILFGIIGCHFGLAGQMVVSGLSGGILAIFFIKLLDTGLSNILTTLNNIKITTALLILASAIGVYLSVSVLAYIVLRRKEVQF